MKVITTETQYVTPSLESMAQFMNAVKADIETLKQNQDDMQQVIEFLALPKDEQRKKLIAENFYLYLIQDYVTPVPSHLKDIYDLQKL